MIITLAKADFSKNNIGVLNSFVVLTDLTAGLVYNGVSTPAKNEPYSATITVNSGYALDSIVVTMGGVVLEDACLITDNGVFINIPSVTGMIIISASSYNTVEPAIITYNYVDADGNVLRTAKTETVAKGNKTFSIEGTPWIAGYDIASVTPETAVVKADMEVNYVYTPYALEEGKCMVACNSIPEDATVVLHASGGKQIDNKERIIVTPPIAVLYQIEKPGYLSQGKSVNVTQNTTWDIELVPFSEGNWQQVALDDATVVESYFINATNAKKVGPHSGWRYYIVPVADDGASYRVKTRAGQSATPWSAFASSPEAGDGTVKAIAYSANNGMAGTVIEEFTIPAGTNFIVINEQGTKGANIKLEKLMD